MKYRIQRQPPRIGGHELGLQMETKSRYKQVFLDARKRERAGKVIYILHDSPQSEPAAKSIFERETKALRYLSQKVPGTSPRIYDSGRVFRHEIDDNPFYYIVVEFIRGKTLFADLPVWISGVSEINMQGQGADVSFKNGSLKDLPNGQAQSVTKVDYIRGAINLITAIDKVKAIHQTGLSHGDLLPSNIIVSNGRAVLIDLEYANIDGHTYSTPIVDGCAMRYSDPRTKSEKNRGKPDDAYSLGCIINDLLPFPTFENEDLPEFLVNAYTEIDALDALETDTLSGVMSELVKSDRRGCVEKLQDPREAELYLFKLSYLMQPALKIVDFEKTHPNLLRSERHHLTNALVRRGQFRGLTEAIKLEPLQKLRDLGKALMNAPNDKRMTAEQLMEQLLPIKEELCGEYAPAGI